MELVALIIYVYIFGYVSGRAHERFCFSRQVSQKVGQQFKSPWLSPSELSYRLHVDQDVVGDLPMVPVVNIWGPPEPRWWMRYITNVSRPESRQGSGVGRL
jgi:hypothetical protein